MALLFIDGFDHYTGAVGQTKWTSFSGGVNATGGRRNGGYAGTVFYLRKALNPADNTTCIVGWAMTGDRAGINLDRILTIENSLSGLPGVIYVNYNSSAGRFDVCRDGFGGGAVLCQSDNGLFSSPNWIYVELKAYIHASAGTVELRLNGVPVCSATGQNTQGFGNTTWDRVYFQAYGGCLDDVYVLDGSGSMNNDFLGDCRVDAHLATADGATHTFTPSSGSDHWQMVNEADPNSDTDYNAATAAGAKDTLVMEDFKNAGGLLRGVQVSAYAKKGDTGTAKMRLIVRHDGTDNAAAEVALATAYGCVQQVYDQNPNGGSPINWTEADFNAAEFGYEKTV